MTLPPILLLGADGFIGRHFAFHFRAEGADVIACARSVRALSEMGFRTLKADLAAPVTHDPEFWRPHLEGGRAVVNAAGLLTGSDAAFAAVHRDAPAAAYAARAPGAAGVLISAVGVEADTPFARWRREGERVAAEHGLVILRPGLVMADTSYGGTSLARALAAMPFAVPVVGNGAQVFNPIHAADLARVTGACLTAGLPPGPHDIGGPERITQAGLALLLRRWLGLPPAPILRIPAGIATAFGRSGDLLRLGPISATAVKQLSRGLEADERPLTTALGVTPRGVGEFVMSRPAGTQDLWHARSYLLRPVIRLTLAVLWLVSGILGLMLPPETFLPLTPGGPDWLWIALARAGGIADLAIAAALVRNWRPGALAAAQAALVLGYTLAFSALNPALWALPLGGLLKNLPILALIAVHAVLERER
ncbi:hypothetical protein HKCCE2091_20130 [Rhodobacterales bacterium HKCCE2091]|nr:hypothetical protein [Rhodobacterales bacterium HKCCE2091]